MILFVHLCTCQFVQVCECPVMCTFGGREHMFAFACNVDVRTTGKVSDNRRKCMFQQPATFIASCEFMLFIMRICCVKFNHSHSIFSKFSCVHPTMFIMFVVRFVVATFDVLCGIVVRVCVILLYEFPHR